MVTVRYPSGLALTYNTGQFVIYSDRAWEIYTANPDQGGRLLVSVQESAGCLVELTKPCVIDAPKATLREAGAELARSDAALRQLHPSDLARIKRALHRFDLRNHSWKA
jgi:hypothetical protein